MNFVLLYIWVLKIILKMCVFFEVFGNLGGILKYEINIIICILLDLIYDIMYYMKLCISI